MNCPNCGSYIKEGDNFCGDCGCKIEYQKENNIDSSNICPQCGSSLNEGDKFCGDCGCKIDISENINNSDDNNQVDDAKENKYCPNCGNQININAKFCEKCGFNLNETVMPKNRSLLKSFAISSAILLLIGITIGGFCYFYHIEECKKPYSTTKTFGDTDASISATYNDKYNIINIDLTLNETIEQWQINELGTNSTDIKLTCTTYDGLKKEFDFNNISLNVGDYIRGKHTTENATLKDFVIVKEVLDGNTNISYSKTLEFDSKERAKLKNAYLRRIAEAKRAQDSADAISTLGGLMMLNMMFGG